MERVTAGQTATLAYTVPSASGIFSAIAIDGQGVDLDASVSVESTTATVTIASGEWNSNSPGIGRLEVIQSNSGTDSVVVSDRFRIMPGLSVEPRNRKYFC